MVLRLEDVHAHYGAIHALKGVSLEVKEGQIVCLIGANGAGKSSTLMAISGILRPSAGRIIFEVIREINAEGTTIFLVEQNAHMALSIAARGYVMEVGRVVLEDDAAKLLANQDVRKAYLGE